MYVEEINSKAAVKFFVTKNSWANLLNRSSVSAAVGGGLMALHGGGVTTDCLAARTLVGGSGLAKAGKASAERNESRNVVRILAESLSK